MSAVFCACSPNCRWTRSPGLKPSKAARSTRRKRSWRPRRRHCVTAARQPRRRRRRRAPSFTRAPAVFDQRCLMIAGRHSRGAARTCSSAGSPPFELFSRAGLAASNSEARRLIRGGGARINDVVVEDETTRRSARRSRPEGSAEAQRRPQAPRPDSPGLIHDVTSRHARTCSGHPRATRMVPWSGSRGWPGQARP